MCRESYFFAATQTLARDSLGCGPGDHWRDLLHERKEGGGEEGVPGLDALFRAVFFKGLQWWDEGRSGNPQIRFLYQGPLILPTFIPAVEASTFWGVEC